MKEQQSSTFILLLFKMSTKYNHHFVQYAPNPIWDPFDVLQINNPEKGGISCIGWAPSQRRRCRNPVNASNRTIAAHILKIMAKQHPDYEELKPHLEELAYVCLCPRYHRNQKDSILGIWEEDMDDEMAKTSRRSMGKNPIQKLLKSPKPLSLKSVETKSSSIFTSRSSARSPAAKGIDMPYRLKLPAARPRQIYKSPVTSISVEIEDDSDDETDTADTDLNDDTDLDDDSDLDDDTDDEDAILTSTPTPPGNRMDQATQTRNIRANQEGEDVDQDIVPTEVSISPPPSVQRPSHSQQDTSNDTSMGCSATHAQRQSLDEECIICKESCKDTALKELTWCKATCGHNLHKACFEEWRPLVEKSRGGLRCILWYVKLLICVTWLIS
jgi:hypothetical protein